MTENFRIPTFLLTENLKTVKKRKLARDFGRQMPKMALLALKWYC